jgi:PAS domain S-box-containing protein
VSDPDALAPRPEDLGGEAPCFAHLFEAPISQGDLATLVVDLADAVVIADPTGRITMWNEAASRLFGWTSEQAVGETLDLIIPERLRARHRTGYERVMETGVTSYGSRLLEVPALHRDGTGLSIAFTVTLIGPPGPVRGIAAVIRDETARWRERRELRAQLEALGSPPPPAR